MYTLGTARLEPGSTTSEISTTIVEMTKGFTMKNNKKTARYSNTKAANFQKTHCNFTIIANLVKVEFIRLAAWLSVAVVIL